MKERIVAIDVARGLAVLGMFVAHLGNDVDGEHSPSWFVVADGRPSALFAILAGVSIGLFTGGRTVPREAALARGYLRVLTRAIAIFVIGCLLMALGTPVAVILPSYAVAFVLVVPAIGARWQLSALFAVVVAVAGPTLVALMTVAGTDGQSWLMRTFGTEESFALDLFVTGYYPAIVWAAYMLLGIAVGRLALRARRVQLWLTGLGAVLAPLGYLGSDALLGLGLGESEIGWRLLDAEPHADSTFELVGNSGVALLTIGLLLLATTSRAVPERGLPPAGAAAGGVPAGEAPAGGSAASVVRVVLQPIAATGQLALTAYSVHIVAIFFLGSDVVWYPESNAVLWWFIAITLVACTLWSRLVGRGPLEQLMRLVTVGPVRPQQAAELPR